MEQLRNYVLSSEHLNHKLRLLKSTNHHHDAPKRIVLRNAFDPIKMLPHLLSGKSSHPTHHHCHGAAYVVRAKVRQQEESGALPLHSGAGRHGKQ
mgnify:CR=1 FL=1